MIKIGITGGIGSGKTMVCKVINTMGYPVYHADIEAKRIINSQPEVVSKVKQLFGENIYTQNGINRKELAAVVFNNADLLQKLNKIVHPAVAADFDQWAEDHQAHSLLFKEAAILFESGAYKKVDRVVAVWAPENLRIKRVSERDGVSPEQVKERMKNQLNQEELLERSDFVIKNNQQELLIPQVVKLIKHLQEL
ncbi:MAG: dephospho-CoA kinase [Bacteroidales bacterium]